MLSDGGRARHHEREGGLPSSLGPRGQKACFGSRGRRGKGRQGGGGWGDQEGG